MKPYFLFFGIIGIIFFSCERNDDIDNGKDLLLDNLLTLTSNLPNAKYVDLMFISEDIGYALSTSFVAKTTDGGYSWTTFEIPEYSNGEKIQFINEQIGYAITGTQHSGTLLKTTNGGQNWEEIDLHTPESPNGICFLDENTGFIVGSGLFIKTTDGGKSWTDVEIEDTYMYLSVNFKNKAEGIATSFNGKYFKTIDGGSTWSNLEYNTVEHLYDIYFVENRTLVSTFHEHLLDLTNNQKVVSLPSSDLKFVFFDSDYSIATGTLITGCWSSSSNIFITSDGWETYTQKTLSIEGTHPICAKMSDKKVMVITDRSVMILQK